MTVGDSMKKPRPKWVYVLQHTRVKRDGEEENKALGVYSSRRMAQQAIEFYLTLPGFRRYVKGFYIEKTALNKREWTEGFVTVQPLKTAQRPKGPKA